jgi:glucose/arabinose dehydrogenase
LKRALILLGIVILCGAAATLLWTRSVWQRSGSLPPRTLSAVRLPADNPFAGRWAGVELWPGLAFDNPVAIVQAPGPRSTYFVAEKHGRLVAVPPGAAAQAITALDISGRVVSDGEAGMVGLALHPAFGRDGVDGSRFIYVFYVGRVGNTMHDRLSRFTVGDDAMTLVPESELVMIDQLDEDPDHNAGHLAFGPDGYLYVSVGD